MADHKRQRQHEAPADNGRQIQQEAAALMRDREESHALSGRETAAWCKAEATRREVTQQPASGANKRQMRGGGAGGQETVWQQERASSQRR